VREDKRELGPNYSKKKKRGGREGGKKGGNERESPVQKVRTEKKNKMGCQRGEKKEGTVSQKKRVRGKGGANQGGPEGIGRAS